MTRDWYFLDSHEQERLIQNTRTDAGVKFESYDINEGLNAYERSLEDIRRAMDLGQTFAHDAGVRATGAPPTYYDDFPSDRGLRDAGIAASDWSGKPAWYQHQTPYNNLYINNLSSDDLWRDFNTDYSPGSGGYKFRWDTADGTAGINHFPENDYILKHAWLSSFKALIQTQRLAALNAGYNNYFPATEREIDAAAHPEWQTARWLEIKKQMDHEQTPWSALYTLPDYEYPTALDAGMLSTQMSEIENIDLPRVDRDFLTNKVINRYWINQVTQRGGADAFVEFHDTKGPSGRHGADVDYPKTWLASQTSETFPTAQDSFPSQSFGIRVPWANSNEGMLPLDLE